MTTLDIRAIKTKLCHAIWLCGRVAVAIELWAWPWMIGPVYRIDKYDIDDYAFHLGPLTLRFRCCFRPDDDGRA
jgi:hypothetical protein